MKLKYIGPHDAVEVPLPFGGFITVKNGEVKDLPDSLSEGLLEQKDNWKKANKKDGEN